MSKTYTMNGARWQHHVIDDITQQHTAKFLDPVTTANGRTLPAGTIVSIMSSGMLNGRASSCCKVWDSGEQVHIYND